MSNPILNKIEKDISKGYASMERMPADQTPDPTKPTPAVTVDGVTTKLTGLFLITLLTTYLGYNNPNTTLAVALSIVALIAMIVTSFKPFIASFTAPLYSLIQGFVVGTISVYYEATYDGIVRQALGLTIGIFAALLFLYSKRVIKVTQRARAIATTATLGIFLYYITSILATAIFNYQMPLIWSTSPIGIAFSLFVAGLASYNFLLDFDSIEKAVHTKADQRYEWALSLGVLATFIWLYIELLRLISKLRR